MFQVASAPRNCSGTLPLVVSRLRQISALDVQPHELPVGRRQNLPAQQRGLIMARSRKPQTVIGLFQSRAAAEDAILELKLAGFADNTIGMVARAPDGTVTTEKADETMAEEGLAAGAVVGAGAGTLIGLGVVAGTIPVIGPVMAVGTLGTILLNAAVGAAAVGVVGALVGMGIPEEDAKYYEVELRGGRFLVTVDAGDREVEALAILRRMGGYNRTAAVSAAVSESTNATRLPGHVRQPETLAPPS